MKASVVSSRTEVLTAFKAFLGLSPDDQKTLADRIINRKP